MNFKDSVRFYLNEKKDPDRVGGGYKAMATRLSKDLGKKITSSQVRSYLKGLEKEGAAEEIEKRSKKATKGSPAAYEWGTKYKIVRAHFAKS